MADHAGKVRLSAGKRAEGGTDMTERREGAPRFEKRMCTHVAWALLTHTALIILLVGHRLTHRSEAMVGQMLLVAMVAMFVLIARDFHQRWRTCGFELSPEDQRRVRRYRRDVGILWILALGLPFFWLAFL